MLIGTLGTILHCVKPAHPLADTLPFDPALVERLADSMRTSGYDSRFPVWTYGEAVLDGRHRQAAAKAAGVAPAYRVFTGTDAEALDFVIRTNGDRRDLTKSQRAMVAARLVTTTHGGAHDGDEITVTDAATRMGCSERYVKAARRILREDTELAEAVHGGHVSLSDAEKRLQPARKNDKIDEALEILRAELKKMDTASAAQAFKRIEAVLLTHIGRRAHSDE